jgi:hypothetical protein
MQHAADYALYMKGFWFHEGEPGRAASPIGYLLSVAADLVARLQAEVATRSGMSVRPGF